MPLLKKHPQKLQKGLSKMALVTSKNKAQHDQEFMNKKAGQKEESNEPKELGIGARELTLHADNNEQLYRTSHQPIIANLKKKAKSGIYDSEKATKLWGHHADRAAHSYHKEFGSPNEKWHDSFSPDDRREAASYWESMHRDEVHEK